MRGAQSHLKSLESRLQHTSFSAHFANHSLANAIGNSIGSVVQSSQGLPPIFGATPSSSQSQSYTSFPAPFFSSSGTVSSSTPAASSSGSTASSSSTSSFLYPPPPYGYYAGIGCMEKSISPIPRGRSPTNALGGLPPKTASSEEKPSSSSQFSYPSIRWPSAGPLDRPLGWPDYPQISIGNSDSARAKEADLQKKQQLTPGPGPELRVSPAPTSQNYPTGTWPYLGLPATDKRRRTPSGGKKADAKQPDPRSARPESRPGTVFPTHHGHGYYPSAYPNHHGYPGYPPYLVSTTASGYPTPHSYPTYLSSRWAAAMGYSGSNYQEESAQRLAYGYPHLTPGSSGFRVPWLSHYPNIARSKSPSQPDSHSYPSTSHSGVPPPGSHPPSEYPGYPGYYPPPHHQGPPHPAWAAQHGYPPGHPAAGYPPQPMRLPPGIRPPPPPQMGESGMSEEQQRQYFHHQQQQQAAYVAHIQHQQAMAAAAAQQQQHLQPPISSSGSSLQPPDASRAYSSTTPNPPAVTSSRASSTGPPPQTNTPDSTSRLSSNANEQENAQMQQQMNRPASQQPPTSRHTPTPTSYSYASNANAPTPPLTTAVPPIMGQPPPTSVAPYYSTPMAYGGMRPPIPPGGKPPYGYPSEMYPGGMPPNYPPQPGMWMGMPPPHGAAPQRYAPPQNSADQFAASQLKNQSAVVTQSDMQRRQQQPPSMYYPPVGPAASAAPQLPGAHSPGSAQRSRYPAAANASLAVRSGMHPFGPPPGPAILPQATHFGHGPSTSSSTMYNSAPSFPPGSVEATTSTAVMKRKRPKIFTRDLTMATPKRILMALRSGLTMETIWAINVLNVMLYDDTTPPISSDLVPDFLNVVAEHLLSILSILFPDYFKMRDCKWMLNTVEADENVAPKDCVAAFVNDLPCMATKDIKEGIRPAVKPPIGRQTSTKINFTRISRTGRPVKEDPKDMPSPLKRMAPAGTHIDTSADQNDVPHKVEAPSKPHPKIHHRLADRVRHELFTSAKSQAVIKKPVFSKDEARKPKRSWIETVQNRHDENATDDMDLENQESGGLFFRAATQAEKWDRYATPNCSLMTRQTALCDPDDTLVDMVNRCLALSNIIRGFSFMPSNERTLSKHSELLRLIGKLLRLFADDDHKQTYLFSASKSKSEKSSQDGTDLEPKFVGFAGVKTEPTEDGPMDHEEPKVPEVHQNYPESMVGDVAAMFLPKGNDQKPVCFPAEDSPERLFLETANHLREDAFVVLAHMSVQLDLFDMESDVSWPIFDALLHWSVTTNLQAKDPLPLGTICPRNYALEILCKMSVIEHNVDLMLSTGPWARLEEFVRVLCSLTSLGEEIPCREFAIVILNAICAASEPACYVAATETSVLNYLVSFLELADSNMHQFVQMQGMQALRENPEMMGTSVGMLRRAASIMVHIARHERCRKYFVKLQNRLLQFTVSHFMDSRVAAMVAEILYEMQRSENNTQKPETDCERHEEKPHIHSPMRVDSAASSLQDDEMSRMSASGGPATTGLMLPRILDDLSNTNETQPMASSVAHLNGTSSLHHTLDSNSYLQVDTERTRKRSGDGSYRRNSADLSNQNHHYSSGDECLKPLTSQLSPSSGRKLLTTSDAVKEKIRNNIYQKHEEDAKFNSGDTKSKKSPLLNGSMSKINGKRSPSGQDGYLESQNHVDQVNASGHMANYMGPHDSASSNNFSGQKSAVNNGTSVSSSSNSSAATGSTGSLTAVA
ncbi:SWI/SNF-like complex subunit domain-containing protein [Ditylenchus destructor]|nr:SWI/SNF-like complex subunit domain-containing protein [Ditylenchus destructor]